MAGPGWGCFVHIDTGRDTARDTLGAMPSKARSANRSLAFSALNALLRERDWSEVTMADVARAAQMSRQTLYSAFGSRKGLAEAYALQLAETFAGAVCESIKRNPGDIATGLSQGMREFLDNSGSDPLINALLTGESKPDLLALITTEAEPIIQRATEVLEPAFADSWLTIDHQTSRIVAEVVARVGISFISQPPADFGSITNGLARVLAPGLEQANAKATAGE